MNDGMIGEEINDTEDNEEIAAEENDSERENDNVSPDTEERRLEEILARTRFDRSATISSVTGTAIAFLIGAASSVLALFVRTDLAIGYTVLAVASYIAAFLMFNCMKVPEFVREKRKANMVFIAVLLSLCAVAAVLAVVMAYVSAEVYGYDSAIYFGTVDGLYYTDTVIYEAADIDIYRIVLLSLAIGSASMSLALAAFSVSGILLTRVPLDRTEENAADVPPDVNNDGQKSLDDVPSSRRNYDGRLEAVRERIAYAEKLYRSGMITEEEYHELKLGILSSVSSSDKTEERS